MDKERIDQPASLVAAENKVQATTKKKKWNEIEITTGLFNTFTNGFNKMGSFTKKDGDDKELIWLVLSTRCLNSMRCAFDLMFSGYYIQSVTIIRSITEDAITCKACMGDDLERIKSVFLSEEGGRLFYYAMAQNNDDLKVYEMYKHQCKFAHSSKLTLGILSNKGVLKVAPSYDELLFNYCMEAFIRTSVMMTEYLARVLYYLNKDEARAFDKENGHNLRRATGWLKDIEK
ncbi:MAG: hypothetical protein ABUK03_03895 [Dehalococcoidales bacterium]